MEPTHLVAGLGNPGRQYTRTRHNAGFLVLDTLAGRWGAPWRADRKFHSRLARMERGGASVLLCQPQTYMNASGEAIGALARWHRVPPARVLVVVDDADLPLGTLRLRPGGSSGGHHGLENIEAHLGTRDYPRQRLGIGRTEPGDRQISGHVLGAFKPGESAMLEKVLQRACEQIECWLEHGAAAAMNRHNGPIEIENDD
jgi:PTH1 family peptidyl-tRNA hydrolase